MGKDQRERIIVKEIYLRLRVKIDIKAAALAEGSESNQKEDRTHQGEVNDLLFAYHIDTL